MKQRQPSIATKPVQQSRESKQRRIHEMRASNLALAQPRRREVHREQLTPQARRCRRKFLRFFPGGFKDETYLAWERDYKWNAKREWDRMLNQASYSALLREGDYAEIALRAVRIESRTNLIFSFEKMALRDAVKPAEGARMFATGLYDFLHGKGECRSGLSDGATRWRGCHANRRAS